MHAPLDDVLRILIAEGEDLETVRKMKPSEWVEMGTPVGLGKRLSREVKFFNAQRKKLL
jgi:hypothetical protein